MLCCQTKNQQMNLYVHTPCTSSKMYSGKEVNVLRGPDCSIFPRCTVVDDNIFYCMSNFSIPHQTVINSCLDVFPKFNLLNYLLR